MSESLCIWRDSVLLTGTTTTLCNLGRWREYPLPPQPTTGWVGIRRRVSLPELHREGSISPKLAHLHLFQAAEAPSLQRRQNSCDLSSHPALLFLPMPWHCVPSTARGRVSYSLHSE